MADSDPRVQFAVRYPAGGGTWRYETVDIPHPEGTGHAPMKHPPAERDLISLWDRSETGPRGIFRVLERFWMHASYGSADFPYGKQESSTGPLLDIICEPAGGPYRDEAPMCGHDGCWAQLLHGEWVPRPGYDEDDLEAHEHYENKEGR